MNLLIFASSLVSLRHIEDEPPVKSIRNKFQPHVTLFTKYLTLYNTFK